MKNAVIVHISGDLYATGGSHILFFSIPSAKVTIPAELMRKWEQPKDGENILYLNPYCTTKEEGGKLTIRYEVVGSLNSSGKEIYPDGYDLVIPLKIIKEWHRV